MRTFSPTLLSLVLIVAVPGLARAQDGHAHDLGEVDFATSCSEAVQPAFNHGVALLHHMTYPQARTTFERVVEQEPSCAMGYWGIAMTLFQPLWPTRPSLADRRSGWEAVERAQAIPSVSERERLFLAAVEAFFRDPEAEDYWGRIRRWEQAMTVLYEAYPTDIEVAAFYALAHLATASPGSVLHQERAAEILLGIYADHPRHPGASHYLIHANDVRGREGKSADVVRGYAQIAPRNPHALHMPTHINVRLGDWQESVEGNMEASAAALEHPAGPHGEYIWSEFAHAIEYLVYSYLQMGDDHAAAEYLQQLRQATSLEPDFKAAFHVSSTPARFALERERWEEAASLPARPVPYFNWDRYWWPEAVTWFTRGYGAVQLGNLGDAVEAHRRLDSLEAAAGAAGEQPFASEIHILGLELEAWIAQREGDSERAEVRLTEAARMELNTPKHPVTPAPTLPAFEQLGDLYLEQGKPSDALNAYELALDAAPRRFRSLVGAARAAAVLGDHKAAASYYERLLAGVAAASPREAVVEARRYLASRPR